MNLRTYVDWNNRFVNLIQIPLLMMHNKALEIFKSINLHVNMSAVAQEVWF